MIYSGHSGYHPLDWKAACETCISSNHEFFLQNTFNLHLSGNGKMFLLEAGTVLLLFILILMQRGSMWTVAKAVDCSVCFPWGRSPAHITHPNAAWAPGLMASLLCACGDNLWKGILYLRSRDHREVRPDTEVCVDVGQCDFMALIPEAWRQPEGPPL